MEDTGVVLRPMTRDEVLAIQPANYQAQSWSYGANDFDCVNRFDPTAFFCCVDKGVITATTCLVKWDDTFAFAGSVLVREEYRGKGYGGKLIYHMRDLNVHRNVGADAMNAEWPIYSANGFMKAYDHHAVRGVAKHVDHPLHKHVSDLSSVSVEDIAAYDAQYFPVPRPRFVDIWLKQNESIVRGYVAEGKLLGYGLLRPGWPVAQIGPLYAESAEIACAVLTSLTNTLQVGEKYELASHTPNPNMAQLSTAFGFEQCYLHTRLYNKKVYQLRDACVYACLSTDIG